MVASRNSTVLAIPREKLNSRLNSDPWFASRFFRALATFLAVRLRMTTARLGYGSAAQVIDRQDNADEIDLERAKAALGRADPGDAP